MNGPDDDSRDAANMLEGKGNNTADGSIRSGRIEGSKPIDLDGRRSMMGRMEAEIRRDLLADIRSGQAAARRRQEAFEEALFARPAETWAEAAEKAEYLLQLFAATPHARAPDRQRIVAGVIEDFARLTRVEQARSGTTSENGSREADTSNDAEHSE